MAKVALFDMVKFVLLTNKISSKDPDAVTPDAKLVDDLKADSLDVVDTSIAFEETFEVFIPGIQVVPETDFFQGMTVGDIVKLLKEKGVPEVLDVDDERAAEIHELVSPKTGVAVSS